MVSGRANQIQITVMDRSVTAISFCMLVNVLHDFFSYVQIERVLRCLV